MRITLVSPYPDITNYGLRTLSAVLKQAGHQVTFLCMPDFAGDGEFTHIRMSEERYPPHVIQQFQDIVRGSDLLGVTLMTHYFDTGKQLSKAAREVGVPSIWGGFHPSVRPDECAWTLQDAEAGDGRVLAISLDKLSPRVWTRLLGKKDEK